MSDTGTLLAEGKTKRIWSIDGEPDMVLLEAKDDITAGDGAKHDVITNKAEWATITTCNVFGLLKALKKPLPVAFVEQRNERIFKAKRCTMLPFEVVIRRAAYGSYLKRHPEVEKGKEFYDLKYEFFLKTTDHRFKHHAFTVDDPMLIYNKGRGGWAYIYDPTKSFTDSEAFLTSVAMSDVVDGSLTINEVGDDMSMLFFLMKEYASQAFIIIEEAWKKLGGTLVDYKVEFGVDSEGNLLLADVIDNDSWRLFLDGAHADKQRYRDGASLEDVGAHYARVAGLTTRFVHSN